MTNSGRAQRRGTNCVRGKISQSFLVGLGGFAAQCFIHVLNGSQTGAPLWYRIVGTVKKKTWLHALPPQCTSILWLMRGHNLITGFPSGIFKRPELRLSWGTSQRCPLSCAVLIQPVKTSVTLPCGWSHGQLWTPRTEPYVHPLIMKFKSHRPQRTLVYWWRQ